MTNTRSSNTSFPLGYLENILRRPTNAELEKEKAMNNLDKEIQKNIQKDNILFKKLEEMDKIEESRSRLQKEQKMMLVANRKKVERYLTNEKIEEFFIDYEYYIDGLFNGNTESLFYAIYKQGGKQKHALEFNGLDAMFTDKQYDKIYSEIDKKYGRSYYEIRKNRDILVKVVVPEICIKLYMIFFNIEDKSIALNMIRNTPITE